MFMRKLVLAGLATAAPLLSFATGGEASSILSVAAPQATPSIVSAGDAAPAPVEATPVAAQADNEEILAIGNSVVAVGADAIPPSREEVASIAEPAAGEEPAPTGWLADDSAPALRGPQE
jgi:hypothetical protein